MQNKNGHTTTTSLFKERIQNAVDKLYIYCSYSSFKTDEENSNSFERFLIPIIPASSHTDLLSPSEYFTIVEEIIEVLNELEQELNALDHKNQVGNGSHTDSTNRLYASLKRHPE